MAEGINIPITMTGADQVERAVAAFDNLSSTLKAAKGSGKALEELRKLLVGLKGKSSALDELATSMKRIGDASAGLDRSMKAGFAGLGGVIQREMATVVATISTSNKKVEELARVAGVELVKVKEATAAKVLAVEQQKGRAEVAQIQANGRLALAADQAGYKSRQSAQDAAQRQLLQGEAIAGRMDVAQVQANNRRILAADQAGYKSRQSAQDAAQRESLQNQKSYHNVRIQYVKNAGQLEVAETRISGQTALAEQRAQAAMSLEVLKAQQRKELEVLKASNRAEHVVEASKNTKLLTADLNDLHSATRGVASGFGMMWLTWGRIVPLLAGASISHSFVQTVKTGAELQQTLATIEHVGGNTREEMERLTRTLVDMGKTGIYGPQEVAEAMKTMSLAGLKADQISASMSTVSNFAVAGTTDLNQAAQTLVAVATAFKKGVHQYTEVSDVISKAAAESMTSVESFSEAMKTASVVNSQYGVSLEDTAAGVAALSQLNISGTSAGTAIKNFYNDISERTPKVSKMLKILGVDFRDEVTGQMKALPTIIQELDTSLSRFSGRAQKDLLKNIATERGGKVLFELLQLYREKIDSEGSKFANSFQKIYETISKESAGFAAITAAQMAQTTQNQFKSLGATLKTQLYSVFTSIEPEIYLVIQNLKKAFSDPDVIGALQVLVKSVAKLALTLSENIDVILRVITVLGAFKLAQLALVPVIKGVDGVMKLLTASITAQGAAASAASVGGIANWVKGLSGLGTAAAAVAPKVDAMGLPVGSLITKTTSAANTTSKLSTVLGMAGTAFMTVGRIIPYVNIAITAGTLAYIGYQWWASKSKDASAQYAATLENQVYDALRAQTEKLQLVIKLHQEGASMADAHAEAERRFSAAAAGAAEMAKVKGAVERQQVLMKENPEAFRRYEQGKSSADMYKDEDRRQGRPYSRVPNPTATYGPAPGSKEDAARHPAVKEYLALGKQQEEAAKRAKFMEEQTLKEAEKVAKLSKQISDAQRKEDRENFKKYAQTMGTMGIPENSSKAEKEAKKAADKSAAEAKRQQDQDQAAVDRYLKGLQDQISKVSELSTMEKLMVDIKEQGLKFSPEELELAKERATLVDARIAKEKEIEKLIEQQNAQMQLQHDIAKAQLDLQNQWATRAMGSNAARVYTETSNQNLTYKQEQERIRKKYRDEAMKASPMTNGGLTGSPTEYEKKKLEELMAAQRVELDQAYAIHQAKLQMIREQEALRVSLSQEGQAGIQAGFQDYLDTASNTYDQMRQFGTNTFNSISDAMTEFVTTGKANFADLAQSIINGLIKIYMQALISGFFKMVTGGGGTLGSIFSGAFSAVFGGGGKGLSTGGYTGAGGKYEPAGIVHRGEGVLSQENIKALGGPLAFMKLRNNLNSGRKSPLTSMLTGYSSGGLVGMPLAAAIESRSTSVTNNSTQNTENTTTNGPTIQVTNHFTVGQNTSRQTQEQISSSIASGLSRAQRRNG